MNSGECSQACCLNRTIHSQWVLDRAVDVHVDLESATMMEISKILAALIAIVSAALILAPKLPRW